MNRLAMHVILACSLALTAALQSAQAGTMSPPESVDTVSVASVAAVFAKLQEGGNLIVLRHGATDHAQDDKDTAHPENCAANRSLTDLGRLNASGWGKVLRRANVSVERVFSSRYCRCVETAERLDLGPVTQLVELTAADDTETGEQKRRATALRALATQVPRRTNLVAVTHSVNIVAAFGADYSTLGEADALVVRPTPTGWELIGRLPLRAVSAYARANGLISSAGASAAAATSH